MFHARALLRGILGSVLAGLLVASALPASAEARKLQFWHVMTGANAEALEEIVNRFNQANEDCAVELVYQGHYRDLFAKLEGAAKAGSLPHLAMIYNNRLISYVKNGFVDPMEPMLFDAGDGFSEEAWADIPAFLRDGSVWDDKHYALPSNKEGFLLFYNKKMLADKGITPPTTWDELSAAAEALTGKTGDKDVVGLALNNSVAIDGSFWVEQAGGHIYDEAADRITFNEEPGVKAYEFLVSMIRKGHAKIIREEKYMFGPFGRGEAAMGITYMSQLPNIIELCAANGVEFGSVELPKGVRKACMFTGTNVTIFNTVPEIERRDAFRFLRFFLTPEIQSLWGTRSGCLPLSWKVLNSKEFREFAEKENPAKLAILPSFEYGFSDPKILNGYAIHDNMSKALDAILLENVPVKEALDKAADQAWKEIQESRKSFN